MRLVAPPLALDTRKPPPSDLLMFAIVDGHDQFEVARVMLEGELCTSDAPTLGQMLETLLHDGVVRIVVDVGDLTLCTSAGVRILLRAREQLLARGGALRVEGASGVVARVLSTVGIN